jgi:uncharacterized protein with GYD domain
MPKYLGRSSYTLEGIKGLIKEGGSGRRDAVEQIIKALGGTLEAYYYALGETDLFFIADLPDNVSVTAGSLLANAAGANTVCVTALLTPEEVDQAAELVAKVSSEYRAPGQ